MRRYKTWTSRWLAFLGLAIFLITIALPPTLTLALQPPARVGRIDLLWGKPETGNGTAVDYLSGSVVRVNGKDVNKPIAPATGKPAPHIEYADVLDLGPVSAIKGTPVPGSGPQDNPLSVLGKRWVVGPAQLVPGGFGPLKCLGLLGCLEPTGRKVVNLNTDSPEEFKLVLVNISKDENVATFEAYVRACIKGLNGKWITCTPYSIPTAFLITLPVKATMPIDIATPAFGFKLSPAALGNIKAVLANVDLKKIAMQTGVGVASSLASGGGSGSNGSDGKGTSDGVPLRNIPVKAIQTAGPTSGKSTNYKIIFNALKYKGTSSADGPDGGNQACAFMVNKVVLAATGYTIGANTNYVPSVEDDLRSGKGTEVSYSNAKPGDIIISKDQRHIGICMSDRCSTVLSNSSSRARFSWQSDGNFDGQYDRYGGINRIYRLK
jgi:cell wall-associated NlpC family hydrolase